MQVPVAFSLVEKWLSACERIKDGSGFETSFDDVTDILTGALLGVPVDEEWYLSEYSGVRQYLKMVPNASASTHYRKHGYFENRAPYRPDWRGKAIPTPFQSVRAVFEVIPCRRSIRLRFRRENFMPILANIVQATDIDSDWYRTRYPDADRAIQRGEYPSAAAHFAAVGYFQNFLPVEIDVEEAWYSARYPDVELGITSGKFANARHHFETVGYREGRVPRSP